MPPCESLIYIVSLHCSPAGRAYFPRMAEK